MDQTKEPCNICATKKSLKAALKDLSYIAAMTASAYAEELEAAHKAEENPTGAVLAYSMPQVLSPATSKKISSSVNPKTTVRNAARTEPMAPVEMLRTSMASTAETMERIAELLTKVEELDCEAEEPETPVAKVAKTAQKATKLPMKAQTEKKSASSDRKPKDKKPATQPES